MKNPFILLMMSVVMLWSCGGNGDQEQNDSPKTDSIQQETTPEKPADIEPGQTLVITGNNVNVRTQPKIDDNVIMQLDSGDQAVIMERGPKEEIGDMVDYWYKVKYKDREMWVYGGITSIKMDGLQIEDERDAPKQEKNVITGTFEEILEQEDASYFIISDHEGRDYKLRIHEGYEGQQIFESNPEDMAGLDIKVTWDEAEVYWESAGQNVKIKKVKKVEVLE